MTLPTIARSVSPVLVLIAVCLTGCATFEGSFFFKKKDSLAQVDDLLTHIEQVHVEAEVARERVRVVVVTLEGIVSPEFVGNAVSAFTELLSAIDLSERQAQQLREKVEPMKKTANAVFKRWATDLEEFTSAEMRQRSQIRLESTRNRYETILAKVESAQWSFDAFNRGMRDHALFLGNDFNTAAVRELQDGVHAMAGEGDRLDERLNDCLIAAREYVQAASLHGYAAEPPRE